jgi:ABC-type multidrug transport system fused ATPase/permease subunit
MSQLLAQLKAILSRRAKRNLILASAGTVVVALMDVAAVALVLPLVSLATGGGPDSTIVGAISSFLGDPSVGQLTAILAAAVVTLFVLKDVGSLAFAWWLNGFVQTERVRTSAQILHRMLSAPYVEVSSRSSAELIRTADAAVLQVFSYTINGMMLAVSNGIAIITMIVALLVIAPFPTLALVVYFGIAGLLFDKVAKPRAAAAGQELAESSMQGYRTALAALGALKEIKLRGSHDHFIDGFRDAQLKGAYAGRTASFIGGLPRYLLEILFIVAVGLVILIGVAGGTPQGGAFGLLALFVAAGFRLLPAVSGLLASVSNIRVGGDPLRLVYAEVAGGPGLDWSRKSLARMSGGHTEMALETTLRLEGVGFQYPSSEAKVLDEIWLEIPQGSLVALTGGSGAGKTTLVDIVLGLYTPTRGRVTVDGRDISDDLVAWQRQLGYVAQDVFLLDASLAENVAFDQAAADIDLGRVRAALAQAQMLEVVDTLPQGLDTQVGERGARLSGGQRQRIGIARALYRNCGVLVLDEATSALDNETESRITKTIKDLQGQMTVIVVAHRLSTVRNADQIVFLERGRVEGIGTFDQLRDANAGFARLVQLGSLESKWTEAGA